jgi:acyl carrier protein
VIAKETASRKSTAEAVEIVVTVLGVDQIPMTLTSSLKEGEIKDARINTVESVGETATLIEAILLRARASPNLHP